MFQRKRDRVYGRELRPRCTRVVTVVLPRISETAKGACLLRSFVACIACVPVKGASLPCRPFRRYVTLLLVVVNGTKDGSIRRHSEGTCAFVKVAFSTHSKKYVIYSGHACPNSVVLQYFSSSNRACSVKI